MDTGKKDMNHLTAGLKIWRNEDYIEYVLRAVYPLVDKIAIAYGPVPVMKVWMPDSTINRVLEFPDPDKKIVLCVRDDWKSITHMVEWTYSQSKELYFKLDGDEIISPELAQEIRENLGHCTKPNRPIVLSNMHFLRSFRREIVKSTIDPWRLRIFRVSQKHHWRHPDFVPGVWDKPTDPGLRLKNVIFHYPYVMSATKALIKLSYHLMNWKRLPFDVACKEARARIVQLRNQTYPWSYREYTGPHPEIMNTHPFKNIDFPWTFDDAEERRQKR